MDAEVESVDVNGHFEAVENDAGGVKALFGDSHTVPRTKDEDVLTAAEAVNALPSTSTESGRGDIEQTIEPPEMDGESEADEAGEPLISETDETSSETDEEKVIIVPNFVDDPIILHVHSQQAKPKSTDDLLPEDFSSKQIVDASDTQQMLPQNMTQSAVAVSNDYTDDTMIKMAESNENDLDGNDYKIESVLPASNESTVEETTSTSIGNNKEFEVSGDERIQRKQIKLVDYASKLAGAQILEHSSSFKGASNLLTGDKDKYSIAPCEDEKYIVIGLSEDILVKKIKLSNYERYSSRVKKFEVLASQEYPTPTEEHWNSIGVYEAYAKSGEQVFELENPTWARYLQFRFLSHYGSEHYCTLSQIKVHGSTMLQGFHEQWVQSEKKDLELEQGGGTLEARDELVGEDNSVKSLNISHDDDEQEQSHDTIMTEENMDDGLAGIIMVENDAINQPSKSRDMSQHETHNEVIQQQRPAEEATDTKGGNVPPQEATTDEMKPTESIDEETVIIHATIQDVNEHLPEISSGLNSSETDGDLEEAERVALDLNESYGTGAISDKGSESTPTGKLHENILPNAVKDTTIEHVNPIGGNNDGHIRNDSSIIAVKDVVKTAVADASVVIKNATRGTIKNVKDAILISVTSKMMGNSTLDVMNATTEEEINDLNGENEPSERTSQELAKSIREQETPNFTAQDNVKTEVEEDLIKEDTAESDSRLEIEPTLPKTDSKATAGQDLLHRTLVASKEMDLTRLFSTISRRFPHAKCLKDLDFQAFKGKSFVAGTGGSLGGGTKMEPIFTKITTEIKSVQNTQHLYEQYTIALKACYEAVFWDIANDLDAMQSSFDRVLFRLDLTEKQQNNLPPSLSNLVTFILAEFQSGSAFQPEQATLLFASAIAIFLLLVRLFIRSKNVQDRKGKNGKDEISGEAAQGHRGSGHNMTTPMYDERGILKPPTADINVHFPENDLLAKELDNAKAQLAERDEKLRHLKEEHTSLQQRYSQLEQTISALEQKIEQLTLLATRNGYTTPPPTVRNDPLSSGRKTVSPTDAMISKEQACIEKST